MNIRQMTKDDIEQCAELITLAYNDPPWNFQWKAPRAKNYLTELFDTPRFIGFVVAEGDELCAAMFAHVKTWWINDLLMVEELFVSPLKQGKGYGLALMDSAGQFSKNNNLGSITLLTNKYMPARSFYEKNNFLEAEQYVLMFKEIESA